MTSGEPLFAPDPTLERVVVSDDACLHFKKLGDFDLRAPSEFTEADWTAPVDVEILGHIFEQSITDLESLQDSVVDAAPVRSIPKRKREGAFYTPHFITRYIVRQCLAPVLDARFEALRLLRSSKTSGPSLRALENPRTYDMTRLSKPMRQVLVKFWESWIAELETLRVLDPACGSGAFLIETFDQFYRIYQDATGRLEDLTGQRSLFSPDKSILENNLYGVDVNDEAVEICRLSIWIKTAQRGKPLTSLDHTIRAGNSIVRDPSVDSRAMDWEKAFPEVSEAGGFDIVVGNPPYIRYQLLKSIRPYLREHYQCYSGEADVYVYFFERALSLVRPNGYMSFVVTNKWMRAGYGAPLRRMFANAAWTRSVIDFGHAKQIFEDADVFPGIIVLQKPGPPPPRRQ